MSKMDKWLWYALYIKYLSKYEIDSKWHEEEIGILYRYERINYDMKVGYTISPDLETLMERYKI